MLNDIPVGLDPEGVAAGVRSSSPIVARDQDDVPAGAASLAPYLLLCAVAMLVFTAA
jgi:hypothetical protein